MKSWRSLSRCGSERWLKRKLARTAAESCWSSCGVFCGPVGSGSGPASSLSSRHASISARLLRAIWRRTGRGGGAAAPALRGRGEGTDSSRERGRSGGAGPFYHPAASDAQAAAAGKGAKTIPQGRVPSRAPEADALRGRLGSVLHAVHLDDDDGDVVRARLELQPEAVRLGDARHRRLQRVLELGDEVHHRLGGEELKDAVGGDDDVLDVGGDVDGHDLRLGEHADALGGRVADGAGEGGAGVHAVGRPEARGVAVVVLLGAPALDVGVLEAARGWGWGRGLGCQSAGGRGEKGSGKRQREGGRAGAESAGRGPNARRGGGAAARALSPSSWSRVSTRAPSFFTRAHSSALWEVREVSYGG